MLTQKKIDKIMFFSIETVSITKTFNELSVKLQLLFKDKFKKEISEFTGDFEVFLKELYIEKAPLHPEFSKIASISWGGFIGEDGKFKINCVSGDEQTVLGTFCDSLNKIPYPYQFSLCSFFCKNFSIPYISKRLLVNGMPIPKIIDSEGLKPWERNHIIDLHEEWAMGVYGSYTSLNTILAMFNIDYEALKPEEVHSLVYFDKTGLEEKNQEKTIGIASLYLAMSLSKVKISIN